MKKLLRRIMRKLDSIANIKVILDTRKTNLDTFEIILSRTASIIDAARKKHPDALEHIEVEIRA